jgi:hypothetical protein
MRYRWLSAVGCGLALAPVGCFLFPKPHESVGKLTPYPPDLREVFQVTYDTRLVELPADDDYLNGGLWQEGTDPLPHHQSALLAANGVQVQVFSGQGTWTFNRLASQSAVAPTLRRGQLGSPKTIPVNGPLDRITVKVTDALTEVARPVDLTAVECGLSATATREPSGVLNVRCEWVVRHGDKKPRWTPTGDGGFDRLDDRSREDLSTLAFTVTIGPSDTLVIGATAKPDGTLGGGFFLTPDGAKRRVLVVKAQAHE